MCWARAACGWCRTWTQNKQVLVKQRIKGPDNQHAAALMRVDLTQRVSQEDDVKKELDQTTEEVPEIAQSSRLTSDAITMMCKREAARGTESEEEEQRPRRRRRKAASSASRSGPLILAGDGSSRDAEHSNSSEGSAGHKRRRRGEAAASASGSGAEAGGGAAAAGEAEAPAPGAAVKKKEAPASPSPSSEAPAPGEAGEEGGNKAEGEALAATQGRSRQWKAPDSETEPSAGVRSEPDWESGGEELERTLRNEQACESRSDYFFQTRFESWRD